MQALLLLGMHRSYTSLVARWLNECGVDMGGELLPDGVGNTDGHFEDMDFFELHRRALRSADLPDNGMVDLEHPRFDKCRYDQLTISGQHRDDAETLLETKCKPSGEPFGWKEPRTCLFLPFYRERLDCRSIVLFRSYQEVVGSLVSREPLAIKEFKYSGLKRPLFWLKMNDILARTAALKDGFLDAWIFYNSCLLDHIEQSSPANVMVHDLRSLAQNSSETITRLREWGLHVADKPFEDIIRGLSNREPLQFDAVRTRRADAITERFQSLIERN